MFLIIITWLPLSSYGTARVYLVLFCFVFLRLQRLYEHFQSANKPWLYKLVHLGAILKYSVRTAWSFTFTDVMNLPIDRLCSDCSLGPVSVSPSRNKRLTGIDCHYFYFLLLSFLIVKCSCVLVFKSITAALMSSMILSLGYIKIMTIFFPLVSHKSGVCYDLTRQKKKICNNLSSYCN